MKIAQIIFLQTLKTVLLRKVVTDTLSQKKTGLKILFYGKICAERTNSCRNQFLLSGRIVFLQEI